MQRRLHRPDACVGLLVTLLVHAGLIAAAIFLDLATAKTGRSSAAPSRVVVARLVRLGAPLRPGQLPRFVAAPGRLVTRHAGVKLTLNEQVTPGQPAPQSGRRRAELPDDERLLAKHLRDAASSARPRTGAVAAPDGVPGGRGSPGGSGLVGGPGQVEGDPRGHRGGDLVRGAAIAGSLWAAEVRGIFRRAWEIPTVIPDATLARLEAHVLVRIDPRGNILGWEMARASKNTLFDGSVRLVLSRLRSLPAPPPEWGNFLRGGRFLLRFAKDEVERRSW
jgi:hypothetical protein